MGAGPVARPRPRPREEKRSEGDTVKPGDLLVWNKYAGGWSEGPEVGEYCGVLLEIKQQVRRRIGFRPARVKVLDADGEILITRKAYVEVKQ